MVWLRTKAAVGVHFFTVAVRKYVNTHCVLRVFNVNV